MKDRPDNASLEGLRFALVGTGRVGGSLAAWLVAVGAELVVAANRSPQAALALCERLGGRVTPLAELVTADLDLLLLAVPDPELATVADLLASSPQARVVFHTSGASPASVLARLAEGGSTVAAFHPLKAFPRVLDDPAAARGVVFGLDGEGPALELASRLLEAWGAVGALIPAESRRLYHFAATLAAGGVVTLLGLATEIGRRLGLPDPVAGGYLELARGALDEVDAATPAAAITGPVARGETGAVALALAELERTAPDLVPVSATVLAESVRQLEIGGRGAGRGPLTDILTRYGAVGHDPAASGTSEGRNLGPRAVG